MSADDHSAVNQIIWLIEDRTIGVLIQLGAHVSLVRYAKDGIDYEVYLENDEFEFIDEGDDDQD